MVQRIGRTGPYASVPATAMAHACVGSAPPPLPSFPCASTTRGMYISLNIFKTYICIYTKLQQNNIYLKISFAFSFYTSPFYFSLIYASNGNIIKRKRIIEKSETGCIFYYNC